MISPGRRTVAYGPVTRSAASTARVPSGPIDVDHAIEGDGGGQDVARRVRVGQRAADRAPVADLGVAGGLGGLRRVPSTAPRIVASAATSASVVVAPMRMPPAAPAGAMPRRLAIPPMSTSFAGATATDAHRGDQALAAGDDGRARSAGEQPDRLLERRSGHELELDGDDGCGPPLLRRLHRSPHLLGRGGHVDRADPKVRQRVADRVDDGRRDGRVAHVAGALRAQRVGRCWA